MLQLTSTLCFRTDPAHTPLLDCRRCKTGVAALGCVATSVFQIFLKHRVLGPLRSSSNAPAEFVEYEGYRNEKGCKATCNARARTNTNVVVQRSDHKGKGPRKTRPQERVCCHSRSSVRLKRIDKIVQRGLEDGEEARAH